MTGCEDCVAWCKHGSQARACIFASNWAMASVIASLLGVAPVAGLCAQGQNWMLDLSILDAG